MEYFCVNNQENWFYFYAEFTEYSEGLNIVTNVKVVVGAKTVVIMGCILGNY